MRKTRAKPKINLAKAPEQKVFKADLLGVVNFISEAKGELIQTEYQELVNFLMKRLTEVAKENHEERGTLYYYLLLLSLKAKRATKDLMDIWYSKMKEHFLAQGKLYQTQLTLTKKKRGSEAYIRLLYFYKLAEHYFDTLGKYLLKEHFTDEARMAFSDKYHFYSQNELLEGRFMEFFVYKRQELIQKFRRHYFIYALLGGMGLIIFWRGVWDFFAEVPVLKNPLISIITGLLILIGTGFFFTVVGQEEEEKEEAGPASKIVKRFEKGGGKLL